ncbi:TonB-dependent receptor plug domain-containing protein [Sphingomonas solaris]|nr:TonB-dependent receptor [Sphingomonas solaris]
MTILKAALAASVSLAAFVSATAAAQETAIAPGVADSEGSDSPSETIIVTGTRRTDRTVADSPVPVDVITAAALQTNGYTETNKLLNTLVPSFNFPQPSITDGTDTVRPATLRGLSPDQTLVLINGKRRHTTALLNINGSVGRGSSAVDINLIPSIALGRVEVLRDGAAAQYGSDAIAGVINFQLANKRDFSGRATITYGRYESHVNGIEGFTGLAVNGAGQPTLAPEATSLTNGVFNTTTTGKDRHVDDGRTVTVAGPVGLPIGEEGYLDVSAEYQDRNPTNRTGYDPRQQYDRIGGLVDSREFTVNRLNHLYGDADTKDMKLFVNAGAPITDGIELYAFGSYNFRDGASAAFFRRPLAADGRNIAAIYPDGFLPVINTALYDISGNAGVRGEVGGWNYDLSGGAARNRIDFFISDTLNRSFGPTSPQAFDAGQLQYSQTTANLDVNREIAVGFLSKFSVAGGLEYRRETFQIKAGTPGSYAGGTFGGASGAQGFPGFAPVIGGQRVDQLRSRDNVSAYVELDADVSDRFNVQLAGRYEDYSDFGSDFNGKAAARLELVKGFAIRGAASTGFRAPSLQQQFYAAQATNNVNGVLLETVTLPVDNPIATALGATALDPETSVSYSAGFVFDAVSRLNVTVDVYQVSIDDRIVVTENLTANRAAGATGAGAAIARILDGAGFNNTNAARFFVNGLDTRTRGLDAVGTYRIDVAEGRLNLTAGFNYNKTKVKKVLAAPGPLANVPGIILFGRQERLRLTDGQPRTKVNFSADFDRDWLGITARTTRYGKVLAAGGELGPSGSGVFNDLELKAKWVTDFELRATLNEKYELAIGANNVFDVYPTKVPTGLAGVSATNGANVYFPSTNYVAPWSAFSPFGFNGRYLYARATARF